ncbi:uncharacterized protein LOC120350824 [Nilaparvata lugens]|uniref:uncharacterized protein LOC120350824 n=1 Tax=Nilaparvata lugens TaxID=108931 RepID=UPI00193D083A|nr:uncharacterized protein LOC120350824 [Nilaparvata lugens]
MSLDSWCPARDGTAGPSMPWMSSSAWRAMSSGSSWHSAGGSTGCPSMQWMTSSARRMMSTGSSRRSAGCGATPVLTFSEGVRIQCGSGRMANGYLLVFYPSDSTRDGGSCFWGVVVRMLSDVSMSGVPLMRQGMRGFKGWAVGRAKRRTSCLRPDGRPSATPSPGFPVPVSSFPFDKKKKSAHTINSPFPSPSHLTPHHTIQPNAPLNKWNKKKIKRNRQDDNN